MIYLVLLLFIAILCFLLLTPVALELDSARGVCRLSYRGVASCDAFFQDRRLLLGLCVLGWRKTIDPFERKQKQATQKQAARKRHISFAKAKRKGMAVMRTFVVRDFYLNLDTDDYVTNAWLFPLAVWLSNEDRLFRINFDGATEFRIRVEDRIGKILLALMA
ncbi:MAG: hypothetical protein Q8922_10255 [Bacteroidota bacterium]|nr:hypothetical protein [Bacteroidota bacterium]